MKLHPGLSNPLLRGSSQSDWRKLWNVLGCYWFYWHFSEIVWWWVTPLPAFGLSVPDKCLMLQTERIDVAIQTKNTNNYSLNIFLENSILCQSHHSSVWCFLRLSIAYWNWLSLYYIILVMSKYLFAWQVVVISMIMFINHSLSSGS